jgi:hypothetical protein
MLSHAVESWILELLAAFSVLLPPAYQVEWGSSSYYPIEYYRKPHSPEPSPHHPGVSGRYVYEARGSGKTTSISIYPTPANE